MKLKQSTAELFIPDGLAETAVLSRVTHLGIGAHQDDLEFMAFHGILSCYQNDSQWFAGVTCTNGAGSSRTGPYAKFSDDQMQAIRRKEQSLAATIGRFGAMIQLDHPSAVVKDPHGIALREDLLEVLRSTRPRVVYPHTRADYYQWVYQNKPSWQTDL